MNIDKEIAEKVMGLSEQEYDNIMAALESGFFRQQWPPSKNINVAMKVVERMRELKFSFFTLYYNPLSKEWEAVFTETNGVGIGKERGRSPAMAICRAALKAVKGE